MLSNKFTECFTLSKLFTLICVILTTFLMLEVLLEFAVIKPTSTSEEQMEFNSMIFPDVVVCVDPAVPAINSYISPPSTLACGP